MAARIPSAALALLLVAGLSACGGGSSGSEAGSNAQIAGAGSAAQEIVQENWIEELAQGEPSASVSYEPGGSGQGRQRFIAGDVAYAATDTPLAGEELKRAVARCEPGELVEVPAYLSRITVGVHVGKVGFVNLTPRTLAGIFERAIVRWDDPAIRRDNPATAQQLRGPIAVLYPAGASGTTANFTEYLSEAAPGAWRHGSSETWPAPKGEAAVDGEAAMLRAIESREGAIGFIDASRSGQLKPVLIETGDAGGVAVPNHGSSIEVLEGSPEAKDLQASPYMLPFELERPYGETGVYPLVFTSYLVACTRYGSDGEAAAVRGLLEHAVGPQGQEAAAREAGADPLAGELRERAEAAVGAIE